MRITVDLLRKRAEHNEGCLSTLKEVTLHQQEIEKIEVIGDVCRQLEIIYLCNNYIGKLEGLRHLKMLQYLNLAINNITVIEGLEGCESLNKLDLTLNFIADIDSIVSLRANVHLETLHLTGNACTSTSGYRSYVAHTLPQLVCLDGQDILKSERISARQEEPEVLSHVVNAAVAEREKERLKAEMIAKGIDPFPARFNEKGERVYGHTPEERVQILREDEATRKRQAEEQKAANKFGNMVDEATAKPVRLTAEEEMEKYGRLLLRNEGKVRFELNEDDKKTTILTVEPGKYISTSAIHIDLQPTYCRITIKDKLLQLVFGRAVSVDKVKVERSMTTGQLKLTVPVDPAVVAAADRFRVSDEFEGDAPAATAASDSAAAQPKPTKTSVNTPMYGTGEGLTALGGGDAKKVDILLPTADGQRTFLKETSTVRKGDEPKAASASSSATTEAPAAFKTRKSQFVEELE